MRVKHDALDTYLPDPARAPLGPGAPPEAGREGPARPRRPRRATGRGRARAAAAPAGGDPGPQTMHAEAARGRAAEGREEGLTGRRAGPAAAAEPADVSRAPPLAPNTLRSGRTRLLPPRVSPRLPRGRARGGGETGRMAP